MADNKTPADRCDPLTSALACPVKPVGVGVPAHVERINRLLAEAVGRDLSSWERNEFLPSLRKFWSLSVKQEKILADLERRVYEQEGDCS